MSKTKIYTGLKVAPYAGMGPTGNIIRDAWVFGLLDESEDCTGWTTQGLESLYDKVSAAWEPYGHLVSNLPPVLRERHQRIYTQAIAAARSAGWDPDLNIENS
ncbi:hypothetical protein TI04_00085 [Achromatium sp. WMS2]|nr:hypothetical protein TI04_00085 [Achromatium sp. WMS2]